MLRTKRARVVLSLLFFGLRSATVNFTTVIPRTVGRWYGVEEGAKLKGEVYGNEKFLYISPESEVLILLFLDASSSIRLSMRENVLDIIL
jgi:hypothetical protein